MDNLKNSSIEELIEAFYLGDDEAWEEVSLRLRPNMERWLMGRPFNLPFQDAEDFIAESFAEFYFNVKTGQEKAQIIAQNDGTSDLNELNLKLCTAKTKFDLSKGSFKSWMWQVVKNSVKDFLKSGSSKTAPISEDGREVVYDRDKGNFYDEKEVVKQVKIIHHILSLTLNSDEFIYFEIWWEKGKELTAKDVIAEIYAQTGNRINDVQVTNLKQGFFAKSYLALIEANYELDRVIDSIGDFTESERAQSQLILQMLENIWQSFRENQEDVIEVMRGLTQYRWREMFEEAENGHNQPENRIKILQIAYGYFSHKVESPRFARLIKIYGADRLGREIRKTFGLNNGR